MKTIPHKAGIVWTDAGTASVNTVSRLHNSFVFAFAAYDSTTILNRPQHIF